MQTYQLQHCTSSKLERRSQQTYRIRGRAAALAAALLRCTHVAELTAALIPVCTAVLTAAFTAALKAAFITVSTAVLQTAPHLAQRVPREAVVGEDAAQVGVVGEEDAEHVPRLTLKPVGGRVHLRAVLEGGDAVQVHFGLM